VSQLAEVPAVPKSPFWSPERRSAAALSVSSGTQMQSPWIGTELSGHTSNQRWRTQLGGGSQVIPSPTLRVSPVLASINNRAGLWASVDLFTPFVNLSPRAVNFAKEHGMWGTLVLLKTHIVQAPAIVSRLDVILAYDRDLDNWPMLCFRVKTVESISSVLEFDAKLREFISESIPPADQERISVLFDF